MFIISSQDRLTLETRVATSDVNQGFVDQTARVRLHVFNQRITPELDAFVRRIAADVTVDPVTQQPFYTVRLALEPSAPDPLQGAYLQTGMQVDVLIETSARLPLAYFVKPISDQLEKAMRKR